MISVITGHNKKLLSEIINTVNGKFWTWGILYKCVPSSSMNPDKVYLGNTVGDFKQRFFNHKKSFNDSINCNDNFQIPWSIKEKSNEDPVFKR